MPPQKWQQYSVQSDRVGQPEFAQPRLSRVKGRSSPARGYKFGCVCSYMAGHEDAWVMTGHMGTNTPKFVPCWGRPAFDPTQTGLCKFGWVWSSLKIVLRVLVTILWILVTISADLVTIYWKSVTIFEELVTILHFETGFQQNWPLWPPGLSSDAKSDHVTESGAA